MGEVKTHAQGSWMLHEHDGTRKQMWRTHVRMGCLKVLICILTLNGNSNFPQEDDPHIIMKDKKFWGIRYIYMRMKWWWGTWGNHQGKRSWIILKAKRFIWEGMKWHDERTCVVSPKKKTKGTSSSIMKHDHEKLKTL